MKVSMFFGFVGLMAVSVASAQSAHPLAGNKDWTPPEPKAGMDYVAPLTIVESITHASPTTSHFHFQEVNARAPAYLKTATQVLVVATGHGQALKCVNAARTALPTRAPVPAAPTVDGCD